MSPGRALERLRPLAPELAVFALAALLYSGSLGGEILAYDDTNFVQDPEALKDMSVRSVLLLFVKPVWGSYHPLHILSYVLDAGVARGLGVGRPVVYHVMNVLYYAICSALVVRVARRFGASGAGALAAGLIFACHPSHAESAAWISGRKDVLSGALVLAALLVALRERPSPNERVLAFALFVLALAAKSLAVVLAPFLVLEAWLRGKLDARRGLELAPFAAIAGAWMALHYHAQSDPSIAAVQPLRGGSVAEQLRLVGWALAWYPFRFLWPHPLTVRPDLAVTDDVHFFEVKSVKVFPDPRELVVSPGDMEAWAVLNVCLLIFVVSARRRGNAALLVAWFFLALGPVSNLVPLPSPVQDRYLFLPSVAAACLLGDLLARLLLDRGGARAAAGGAILGLALGLAAGETVRYERAFTSDMALWHEILAVSPGNQIAHWGLAYTLEQRGEHDRAAGEAEKIDDGSGLGWAIPQLKANIAENRGRKEEARKHFARAWQDAKAGPHIGAALVRLALELDDREGAQTSLDSLVARWPGYAQTRYWQGRLAELREDLAAAEPAYRDALALGPGPERVLARLGIAKAERSQGKFDAATESVALAEKAGALPETVDLERAQIALARGDGASALRFSSAALAAKAEMREARRVHALALAAVRRLDEAAAELTALLGKDDEALVSFDLARVEARAGREETARAALERAIAGKPGLAEKARQDPLLAPLLPP